MKHIRLATAEEIEGIKDRSDLMPGATTVFAYEGNLAVARRPLELNPVIFAEGASDVQKVRFIYSLEERMLGSGFDRYYSQIACSDEHWQQIIEKFGFERVSPVPEYRYLRVIRD